jgi:hypothetical protein
MSHHRGSIGELRDDMRRHETGDIDLDKAGVSKHVEQRRLRGRRQDRFHQLQPIAQPDLANMDIDVARHGISLYCLLLT